jgi:hypothetical protein
MLMVTALFLLKPDRLEAYPTCLGSVSHWSAGSREPPRSTIGIAPDQAAIEYEYRFTEYEHEYEYEYEEIRCDAVGRFRRNCRPYLIPRSCQSYLDASQESFSGCLGNLPGNLSHSSALAEK